MPNTNSWFAKMAQKAAKVTGSSLAFMAVCLVTVAWLGSGPFFRWSDAWQLVINTFSNIVAMLMLFLIQNTQNRDTSALQLKVDELLRAVRGAKNAFINLEELTEEDLTRIKERYARLAETGSRLSSALVILGDYGYIFFAFPEDLPRRLHKLFTLNAKELTSQWKVSSTIWGTRFAYSGSTSDLPLPPSLRLRSASGRIRPFFP